MSDSNWSSLEQAFEHASGLGPEEQAAYLEELARQDENLAREVRALLKHDRSGAAPIAEIVGAVVSGLESAEPDWTGRRIGPFVVDRELGRGGMGVVFAAHRADGEFDQQVALKIALRAIYSASFRERFRQERQILARLVHPHIARLLDGGATDEGLPYFAMEFVDGEPISKYIERVQPSEAARLELFEEISSAVDYAHQNLIVHRDIKPGNVLVDRSGVAKLLDFGIAKLLEDQDGQATRTVGPAPLTPDYSSPEQLRGEAITTRTDVYQLGLMLCEILTGDKTVKPAGELGIIASKATQAEPERRYSSVAELAADLRRYREGRPILARPDSWSYRAGKFVRRNRLSLSVAAVVVVLLAGATAFSLEQARRATRRFDQVRTLSNKLLFEIHDAVRGLPGSLEARKLVVETGLSYLDALATEARSDAGLATDVAAGYVRIAAITHSDLIPSLGKRAEAEQLLQKASELIELPFQAGRPTAAAAEVKADIAIETAQNRIFLGKSAEGRTILENAIKAIGPIAETAGAPVTLKTRFAELHMILTREFQTAPDAPANAKRLLELTEKLVADHPNDVAIRSELAVAYGVAASVQIRARKLAEAMPLLEKAVAIHEGIVKAAPDRADLRRGLMLAYARVGDTYWGLGKTSLGEREKGQASYAKMAEQAEWLYKADPTRKVAQADYAISLMRHADSFAADDLASIEKLNAALAILDKITSAEPKETRLHRQQVDLYWRLAGRLAHLKRQPQAIAAASAGLKMAEGILALEPAHVPNQLLVLRAQLELATYLSPPQALAMLSQADALMLKLKDSKEASIQLSQQKAAELRAKLTAAR